MPLPESGRITIDDIATEFGVTKSSVNLSADLATFIGQDSGDRVKIADFYGASSTKPSVQTSSTTSVAQTSMTINANVTAQGSAPVTSRGFWFGTANTYNGEGNTQITVGSGTGTYSSARTGLTAGTTYYIFAFATNSQGTTISSGISQATQSASETKGSVYRDGTTNMWSIANRIIMKSTNESTTGLRLSYSTNFTLNFWLKVGWTQYLNSQGTYQFLWGVSANAIQSPYSSNVYNQNVRLFFREDYNRLYFGFLGNNIKYAQNYWQMNNSNSESDMAQATGLGNTFWSNTNNGNVNSNGYCMITITFNGTVGPSNCKLYWNGVNCGSPAFTGSNGQTNGTPAFNTTDARLMTILGGPYSANNSYGGTGDLKAGYLGGNGDTYMDEYSLWNSALSQSAIEDLYNEGEGGTISKEDQPEGLITYYDFNSNSQDTTNKTVLPVWPDPSTNSNKGKFEIDGTSGFGSGSNTIDG
jgi:hypothetical protein